jgi:hypothetical protein
MLCFKELIPLQEIEKHLEKWGCVMVMSNKRRKKTDFNSQHQIDKDEIDFLKIICDRNKEYIKYAYEDKKFLDSKFSRLFLLCNALIAAYTSVYAKYIFVEPIACTTLTLLFLIPLAPLIWCWWILLKGVESKERLTLSPSLTDTHDDLCDVRAKDALLHFAYALAHVSESINKNQRQMEDKLVGAYKALYIGFGLIIISVIVIVSSANIVGIIDIHSIPKTNTQRTDMSNPEAKKIENGGKPQSNPTPPIPAKPPIPAYKGTQLACDDIHGGSLPENFDPSKNK